MNEVCTVFARFAEDGFGCEKLTVRDVKIIDKRFCVWNVDFGEVMSRLFKSCWYCLLVLLTSLRFPGSYTISLLQSTTKDTYLELNAIVDQ
jgi:hypothetical protein